MVMVMMMMERRMTTTTVKGGGVGWERRGGVGGAGVGEAGVGEAETVGVDEEAGVKEPEPKKDDRKDTYIHI